MQKEKFLEIEGSNWYNRNKKYLNKEAIKNDKIIEYFKENINLNNKTLEIGCSNGWRINELQKTIGGKYFGIEPSKEAVEEGKITFPNINLYQGTADNLPFENNYFDNIIIGFCLYLCDRDDLFKIAYEIDRVLKDGGNIIILDFEPGYIYKNEYIHLKGINSYKMDYTKLFLWNPHYFLSKKDVYSHTKDGNFNDPNERISLNVLKKT